MNMFWLSVRDLLALEPCSLPRPRELKSLQWIWLTTDFLFVNRNWAWILSLTRQVKRKPRWQRSPAGIFPPLLWMPPEILNPWAMPSTFYPMEEDWFILVYLSGIFSLTILN